MYSSEFLFIFTILKQEFCCWIGHTDLNEDIYNELSFRYISVLLFWMKTFINAPLNLISDLHKFNTSENLIKP